MNNLTRTFTAQIEKIRHLKDKNDNDYLILDVDSDNSVFIFATKIDRLLWSLFKENKSFEFTVEMGRDYNNILSNFKEIIFEKAEKVFFEGQEIISIDPSGTGTTALCHQKIFNEKETFEFNEFKSPNWQEHLQWIINYLKENSAYKEMIIIYEYSNYLNRNKGFDTINLFRLMGAIEALKYVFPNLKKIVQIYVKGVKEFYKQLQNKQKQLPYLNYKVGRGGGWLFTFPNREIKRLSEHMRDAYILNHLYHNKIYWKSEAK